MSKVITETLTAITEFLTQQFPESDVERDYKPNVTIDKVKPNDKPRILVSLYDRDIDKPTRSNEYDNIIVIDISIVKKINQDTNKEIDPLVDLVGSVFETIYQNPVITHDGRQYRVETIEHGEIRQVYYEEFLQNNLFFGAMMLKVKATRRKD